MVSEENRILKFASRRKFTPERREKQKAILERARQIKVSKPIPLTYKQRLDKLENSNTNTNNNNNNSDENDELISTMDYLIMKIDELQEENNALTSRMEDLESNVDANEIMTDDIENDIQEMKESISNNNTSNNTSNNQPTDNPQIEINKLNDKIKSLESNQEDMKKDITEIFNDLNEIEDSLDN